MLISGEYLLELREFHRFRGRSHGICTPVKTGEVVVIYEEKLPRSLWRVGVIEDVIKGSDNQIRGARVRVISKTVRPTFIQRPIQHLYPLEICPQEMPDKSSLDSVCETVVESVSPPSPPDGVRTRSRRSAALEARNKILGYSME
jgi:hypothetical protein